MFQQSWFVVAHRWLAKFTQKTRSELLGMFKVFVFRGMAHHWLNKFTQKTRSEGLGMFKVFVFRCVAHRWQTRQMLRGTGRFMRKWSAPVAPFRYIKI
jgi:hypothetical protein